MVGQKGLQSVSDLTDEDIWRRTERTEEGDGLGEGQTYVHRHVHIRTHTHTHIETRREINT